MISDAFTLTTDDPLIQYNQSPLAAYGVGLIICWHNGVEVCPDDGIDIIAASGDGDGYQFPMQGSPYG